MKRKIMKILVLVFILILLLPVTNSGAAGDSKPPVLHSLKVSTAELKVGDTLEIIADVTDDISGVSEVQVYFQHAVNQVDRAMFFQLEYDEKVGVWKTNYVIKESDVGGKWRIESIHLRDFAGNYNFIHESKLVDKENYSYFINNSNDLNITPPIFQSGEVIENELVPGQELIVKVKATHEKGIKSISAQYKTPNKQSGIGFGFQFDNDTGYWIAKHPIGSHYQSGIWEFEGLNIESNTGSRLWIGNENNSISSMFDFKINNDNTDSLPPTVKSIKITPRSVKVGDDVLITVETEDDISGVGDVHLTLTLPSGNSQRNIPLNDINNDGIFVGSYKIKKYDEEGQWNLQSIVIYDNAQNVKQYFPSDFENHSELHINVENNTSTEGDVQTPLALKKIEVVSNTLNVGDELIVNIEATQNVKHVQMSYSININGKRSSIYLSPRFDKKTQSWIGKYTVQSNDKDGIWTLDDIILSSDDDVRYINPIDLPDSQRVNITINNTEPLAIKSIDVSKQEINVGEKTNIVVRTQGDSSRISEVGISYRSPFSEVFGGSKHLPLVYDSKLEAWVGDFKAEEHDVNGVWRFDYININENNNSYLTFYKEDVIDADKKDITINTNNIIDLQKTVTINHIGTIGKRESIRAQFFADDQILEMLEELSEGHVVLVNEAGEIMQVSIDESKISGNQGDITFEIPVGTREGKWEFKEIVLHKNGVTYRIDHFINTYFSDDFISYKFYVPSIEADHWVRLNLAPKINISDNFFWYGDHLHLIANSSMSINNFIERYKEALPPQEEKVDYHKLLTYAYRGFAEWDDPFLYQWWKEGLIDSIKEPIVPVQVYGSTNTYSNKLKNDVEIYFTEVLHYLPAIHNAESKVTAYIRNPSGVEFAIDTFVYDDEFQRAFLDYELSGGWISDFKFPENAVSGSWIIDRVEVQNESGVATYSNGVNFYGGVIEVIDGVEMVEPEEDVSTEITPPVEITPPNNGANENNNNTNNDTDKTPPTKPIIHNLTDSADEIVGLAEAGSIISVKVGDVILYTVTVGSDGKFVIPINKLASGTVLLFTVTNLAGQVSEVTQVIVEDRTAPNKPVVNSISDTDTKLTGMSEAKSVITIEVDNKLIGKSLTDNAGMFSVDIPKQEAGTELRVKATDEAGNDSQVSIVIVEKRMIKFNDVGATYQEEISYLVKRGIIKGYPGNKFRPQANTKRLQAILMILREKGVTDFTAPDPGFSDIKKGDYGYDEIAKAVELGIIDGKVSEKTGNKYFDPNGILTRGQMSKIMSNAYVIKGKQKVNFTDVKVNDWYYPYISILVFNKIANGYEDNSFKPNKPISREHFSVMLARYLNSEFKR